MKKKIIRLTSLLVQNLQTKPSDKGPFNKKNTLKVHTSQHIHVATDDQFLKAPNLFFGVVVDFPPRKF